MPGAQDAMLARLTSELEERRAFQDQLVESAQEANRDLNEQEMALYTRAAERMTAIEQQLTPLREGARIAVESHRRTQELTEAFASARDPRNLPTSIEYRSAGEYMRDHIRAFVSHDEDTVRRLDVYNRAAAHQTTADVPGLLPERLLAPILQNLDFARPLVSAIGVQQLPAGSWSRPRVTQHTSVSKQSAEKTELASQKMIIDKIPLDGDTWGGYVNLSRQAIDWTQPQVLDIVIADLTSQYAYETEAATGTDLLAAATAGPTIPASPTAQDIANALWEAAGMVGGAMWDARTPTGRLIFAVAFDMLALLGPLFAPVNPQNAQTSGFNAAAFGEGAQPPVSGISTVVSGALADGTALVFSSNAVEAYEDRIGALQVVEPSVLGTQVAYAGHFALPILQPTGIVKVTKA
jgi:HK97 family phage major capsid protein